MIPLDVVYQEVLILARVFEKRHKLSVGSVTYCALVPLVHQPALRLSFQPGFNPDVDVRWGFRCSHGKSLYLERIALCYERGEGVSLRVVFEKADLLCRLRRFFVATDLAILCQALVL